MRFTLVILIVSLLSVNTASAKTAKDCHRELKQACKTKKGKARLDCMREGATTLLDQECQTIINDAKDKFNAGGEHPCKLDRDKCPDEGGGPMKVIKCLLDRRAELSDSCKKHIDDRLAERPCTEDRLKHCTDIKVGEGRVYSCLKSNEASLTAACKEKLAKSKKTDFDTED